MNQFDLQWVQIDKAFNLLQLVWMDKLDGNSYTSRSSLSQTPEKTTSRMKQLEREVSQFRQLLSRKDEEIEHLNSINNQLMMNKSSTSKKPSDTIYESSLQDQISRLNSKLAQKSKEYERLYQKHSTLQNDLATLEDFAADLDRERKFLADKLSHIEIHTEGDEVVGELENKLVLMSTEIMRLGQLSRNKTQQNNDLRFRVKSQEQQLEQIQNELAEKQKALTQYRERLRNLEKKQLQLQSNKEYENESTYKILSLEIERLNVLLHNKFEEISTLQHRNKVLEDRINLNASNVDHRNYGQLQIQIQRLNKVNMISKQDIEALESQVKKVRKENKEIGDDNQKCKRTIKRLEQELEQTRRSYIKNQNEKIRIEIETSEKTIREQKSTIEKLQKQAQAFNEQKEQQMKSRFEEEVTKLKTILHQSQAKCSSLCNDLLRYEQKLVMLSQEVERLSLQNNKYQQENADLKRLQYKIESKERQLKEIERTRESAYVEIKRDKNEIERLKGEVKQLWEKNREFQSKQYQMRTLTEELQMVTDRLNSKQRECKILQQKIEEQASLRNSAVRAQNLESQLESERKAFRLKQQESNYYHEKQIQNFKDTITKLDLKVKELSSEQFSSESNYAILAEEIRRLNEVLSQSSQTIINQKREISLLESNLETAQMSLEKIKGSHYTNEKVEEQILKRTQVYTKELGLYQQENGNLKSKIQDLTTNCALLEHEAHNSKLALQDTRQALRNKQIEMKDLLEQIRSKKKNEDSLLMLIKDIKESNLRLERKLAEIEQDYIKRLEEKTYQKQQLERQYIDYNRKVREAEIESTNLKFEVGSLQNKLDMLNRQFRQVETDNQRIRNRLDEELREKANLVKVTSEEYQAKISEYERQLKRNAKSIGEYQADSNNKNHQIYRLEGSIRQLEEEKQRLQEEKREVESEKKREFELKIQQTRISLEQKQSQLATLRQQILLLQEQVREKDKVIQSKSQLIFEYENKLAMLSQELERINTIVYNKNAQIHELTEKMNKAQQSLNKQGKETLQIFTIQITRLNITLCESLEQIRQLQQEIQNKNREISRVAELNKKNQQVLKDKIFELEQENEKTLQQNHKLAANGSVLARKIEDMQRVEAENENLKLKMVEVNSEKNRSKNAVTDLESEIERLRNTYQSSLRQQKNSLTSKASLQLGSLEEEKRQLERKVTMLVSENEQLVSQIQNLRRELEACDQQFTSNKKQLIRTKNQLVNLTREKEKYRLINEEVMSKVEKISFNRTSQQADKQVHELQVRHLQGLIREYESQMTAMKQQIERLSNREKSRENSSVGSSNNPRSSLSKGQGEIQQKYNILESLHLKLKREADGLREKVAEYQLKMKKLKAQFDLITKLTHEYKDENDYLRSQNHSQCVYVGKVMQNQAVSMPSSASQAQINAKNEDILVKQTLASEIDRLSIINNNLRRQVEDFRVQAADHQSIKIRYEQLMATFVLTAAEIQALRLPKPN